jgi:hypothetical protein
MLCCDGGVWRAGSHVSSPKYVNTVLPTISITYSCVPGSRRIASNIHPSGMNISSATMSTTLLMLMRSSKHDKSLGLATIHHFLPVLTSIDVPRPLQSMWNVWNAPAVAARPHLFAMVGYSVDPLCPILSFHVTISLANVIGGCLPSVRGKSRPFKAFPFGELALAIKSSVVPSVSLLLKLFSFPSFMDRSTL